MNGIILPNRVTSLSETTHEYQLSYWRELVHTYDKRIHSLLREVEYLSKGEALNAMKQSRDHHRLKSRRLLDRIRELQQELARK